MEPATTTNKLKNPLIISIAAAVLLLIGTVIFGYLYYTKNASYNDLNSANIKCNNEKSALEKQASSSSAQLRKQIKDCQDQKTAMEAANKAKTDKITAYNTLFSYFITVLRAHGGLNGWTDAEYQKARGLAQTTGDPSMLSKTDWAWNHHEIDQITRLADWLDTLSAGITNTLK